MVPLMDLKAQYLSIKDEIDQAIDGVIDTVSFIGGKENVLFEEEFAGFCGAKSCRGVGNGTDALFLTLKALNIGEGDEVLTSPYTFIATVESISRCGARVSFVDIDKDTYCIDPDKAEDYLKKNYKGIHGGGRIRAIIPVHLYGHPADMDSMIQLAKTYDLMVIEDAAQAHGALYKGRRVGSIGDAGCFSFYPGKNLGAYGDAGAVISNNLEIVEPVRLLSDHGRQEKYTHLKEGYNSRLDSIQAAVLRVKLKHLDGWNDARRRWAALYGELLSDLEAVKLPFVHKDVSHVYHLFVILCDRRDELRKHLTSNDIGSGLHYPLPLHLQPAYKGLGLSRGSFPVAERCSERCISIPMYPEMGEESVQKVAECIRDFYRM